MINFKNILKWLFDSKEHLDIIITIFIYPFYRFILCPVIKFRNGQSRIKYILCECTKGQTGQFYQESDSNGNGRAINGDHRNFDLNGNKIKPSDIIEGRVISSNSPAPSWGNKIDWKDLFNGKKETGSWALSGE